MRSWLGEIKLKNFEQAKMIRERVMELEFVDALIAPFKTDDGKIILEFFEKIKEE